MFCFNQLVDANPFSTKIWKPEKIFFGMVS